MSFTLVAFFTFVASAQNKVCKSGDVCPEGKTQCENVKKPCDGNQKCNPFEGIELTAEQKVKIDELKAKCAAEKVENKLEGDKVKCEDKGRKMLDEIKKILTPEQYVQFLENNFLAKGKMAKGPRHQACDKPCKDVCKGQTKKCEKQSPDCRKDVCKKSDCDKKDCKDKGCKKTDCKKNDCKDCKDCKMNNK